MPRRFSKTEIERFVRGRRVGVLGTSGEDGAPVLTPIWYVYDGAAFLMRTGKDSVKARNILRDPRASLCVQDERAPYASVTVYGKATIEPEVPGLDARVARRYLGAVGARAYLQMSRESIEQSEEITVVLRPDRYVSQDFSSDLPAVGKVWMAAKRVLPPQL